MKIIHFSGLRLGAAHPDWPDRGEAIRERQRVILDKVFRLAEKAGALCIVCSGDLFDSAAVWHTEAEFVTETCRRYPSVYFVILPGGRDPWATFSPHRYLTVSPPANLVVLTPGDGEARQAGPGLWVQGLPIDAGAPQPPDLRTLARSTEEGVHLAVAYGDMGRLKSGPEEGLVMVPPEVAGHPFDYLALADGGPAEHMAKGDHPACYASGLMQFDANRRYESCVWQITLEGGLPKVERLAFHGITAIRLEVDISQMPDLGALVTALNSKMDPDALVEVVLRGRRPADQPVLEPRIHSMCTGLLGVRVLDQTELAPPAGKEMSNALLRALWEEYARSDGEAKTECRDAIKLLASGITNPVNWKEAPWARS